MMTDPIADMLTHIRNGSRVEKPVVEMPASGIKKQIAAVLKDEGFIVGYDVGKNRVGEDGSSQFDTSVSVAEAGVKLRVYLKYGPEGERVIRVIDRKSRPGCRVYKQATELRPVLDGLGIAIISTSHGVMSDRKARANKVGGEYLCEVW